MGILIHCRLLRFSLADKIGGTKKGWRLVIALAWLKVK